MANKPLIVQKFGGTSVGSIERIHKVADHIIKAKNNGNHVVVVVSAMSGETNRLMDLAKQVDNIPNARELDVLLSAGEVVSMALLTMALTKQGYAARSLTGSQAHIMTDDRHNDATITHIDPQAILECLANDEIVIVAGFQGINEKGDITTLGRGGSDTSAVALAGALAADECQIFTDVDGIYTCDPRVVSNAKKFDVIDFPSMKEMASKGAKVLHLPSVIYAWEKQVPLRVLSTFDSSKGTLVKGDKGIHATAGIALQRDLMFIECEASQIDNVEKQCHILGFELWGVENTPHQSGIMVKQDTWAKLQLVLDKKIKQCTAVSMLTMVGLQAVENQMQAKQLLQEQGIEIVCTQLTDLSLMFVMFPECIDLAASILHDAYINENGTAIAARKDVMSS